MRVLITGAYGQVGQALLQTAPTSWLVLGTSSNELDISNAQHVISAAQAFQPQLIINAAAYTAVDSAETNRQQAENVNHLGAANLAQAAQTLNCPLLHLSTDYVFSGQHSKPYTESDTPNPLSVYGASKWRGEQAVQQLCAQHIILRTSWVFAAHGHNFVKTMLRLGQERDALSIISDQIGNPTSAQSIAQTLWQIAEHYRSTGDCAWGTYHFSSMPSCSWYAFATEIFRQAVALDLLARSPALHPICASDYPASAPRPAYSVLDSSKLEQQFNIQPNHWPLELNRVLQTLKDAQQ